MPRTNDHIMSLRMPKATRALLDRLARSEGVPVSEVIRRAVEQRAAAVAGRET